MAGKFQFTLKEYQEAAVKYRSDLLMLPIIGIGDTLQYMTVARLDFTNVIPQK